MQIHMTLIRQTKNNNLYAEGINKLYINKDKSTIAGQPAKSIVVTVEVVE
jgi:hypothetical protein